MARSSSSDNPQSPESCWIRYQLALRNIKREDVAKKANRSGSLVSLFISGQRNSEAVEAALAQILGFSTYEALMEAAYQQTKEGAA